MDDFDEEIDTKHKPPRYLIVFDVIGWLMLSITIIIFGVVIVKFID